MAPPQEPKADEVPVNIAELRESKDAILMRLISLQAYIADLSKAYVEHIDSVISGGPASISIPSMPIVSLKTNDRAGSPEAKSEAGGSKKRKRAAPDPNAPKRPLTPFFLYMSKNRESITLELGGPNANKKAVSDEGAKRWQEMSQTEKDIYKKIYTANYEDYKKKLADYKAGKAVGSKAEDDLDPAATQLQQDFAGAENDDKSDDSSSSDEESEEESSPSPPSPPKEKTPRSKRSRTDSKAKEVPDSAPKESSPVKKGRGKKAVETPATETKTKGKGKKRKSEA